MTIDCKQDRRLGTTRSSSAIPSEKQPIELEFPRHDKTIAQTNYVVPRKLSLVQPLVPANSALYDILRTNLNHTLSVAASHNGPVIPSQQVLCKPMPKFTHEKDSTLAPSRNEQKSEAKQIIETDVPLQVQLLNKIVTLGKKPNCEWVTVVNELSKALPALKKPCRRVATTGTRRSLVPKPSFVRFPAMKPRKDEPISISKIEPNYGPVCGGVVVRLHVNNINTRSMSDISLYLGKMRIRNIRSISPSVICFIAPANEHVKKCDIYINLRDGFHSDRCCYKAGFEYLSMDAYLERKNVQEKAVSWDNGIHKPVTLVNTTQPNDLENGIQLLEVKLGDETMDETIESLSVNKIYNTNVFLNVNSVYQLRLNTIQYDYEWEIDDVSGAVICNGDRKATILDNGTVVLRLSMVIVQKTLQPSRNIHVKLRQRSTGVVIFETIVEQLVDNEGDDSKITSDTFMVEKLSSKCIDSPMFLSNVLGQTEMHQCCVSGDMNELSKLRSTCDTYTNCFNMIVCARDHFLRNALHLSFAFGHLEITKYLVYRVGVEMASDLLLQRDYFGMTPFHLAVHYRHKHFLSALCTWMGCYTFTQQTQPEHISVPQVLQKTFQPVIVPNASRLSVINLISEDCEMVEKDTMVPKERVNEPPKKRKREAIYAANKKTRKESPKLDNVAVM